MTDESDKVVLMSELASAYETQTVNGKYNGIPVILTALFPDGMSFVQDEQTQREYLVDSSDVEWDL